MSPTGVVERPADEHPAELPRVDPRMRDRWVRARRQEGRRRLRLLVAAGVAAAVVVALGGVAESPLLAVRHVNVSGATNEPASEVTEVSGLGSHPPMISFDGGAVVRRIESMPWVAKAWVSRQWPDSVDVRVSERTAVAEVPVTSGATPGATMATLSAGSATWLIDATGRVLGQADGEVPGLPVILGVASPRSVGGWLAGTTSGAQASSLITPLDAALNLATLLPAAGSANVSGTIAVSEPSAGSDSTAGSTSGSQATGDKGGSSATVQIPVFFGDSTDLKAKVVALQTLMSQQNLSDVTGIDVSDSQRLNLTTNS
jgi:cell division protein FtsQ